MSENNNTPFEKAQENAKIFIERADMLQSLSLLKKVIDDAKDLSEDEKAGVSMIVEVTLRTLSDYLVERGYGWN